MEDNKKQKIKDSFREIQGILRQKELLMGELDNHYNLLKSLGYPKNIVNSILKDRKKPKFQIENEKFLIDELQAFLDS